MKTFIAVLAVCASVSAQAVVVETASKLAGNYVASGNCLFETASVKNVRDNNMDYFVVGLLNKSTNTFRSRTINMDNLWTKVRTTRGMQRIVTHDVVRANTMLAEEKTCLPGWVGCSEFETAMSATIVDENTMDVVMGNESCTFTRTK